MDAADLLRRVNDHRHVYEQRAVDEWLQQKRLTAAPPVVDRLNVPAETCSRTQAVNFAQSTVFVLF